MNQPAHVSRRPSRFRAATTGRFGRGQSLVEFALVLPIILLVLMMGIDFGRIYLGYVNVQNMARIAANYAANHPDTAWGTPTDPDVVEYRELVLNDAQATNCALPETSGTPQVPGPQYTDRGGNGSAKDVGDTASVVLTCTFKVGTPIISSILGGSIPVSASAEFPVKSGLIASGGGIQVSPTAAFTGTPQSGPAPLVVQFTDLSTDGPKSWLWDFDNDGSIDSTAQDPSWTFSAPGAYTVTLVAGNDSGTDTETRNNYVTVGLPLADVSFTATPGSGPSPLIVQFTDTSTNSPTAWEWDFEDDGTVDSTDQNPTWTYTVVGSYSVRLTVTNVGGTSSTLVADLITVTVGTCVVPDFFGTSTAGAQALWESRGFTTTVTFQQGNLPWTIQGQSQAVDQGIPCNSPISVRKN
jgi:PKD repeat protein